MELGRSRRGRLRAPEALIGAVTGEVGGDEHEWEDDGGTGGGNPLTPYPDDEEWAALLLLQLLLLLLLLLLLQGLLSKSLAGLFRVCNGLRLRRISLMVEPMFKVLSLNPKRPVLLGVGDEVVEVFGECPVETDKGTGKDTVSYSLSSHLDVHFPRS